jgi:MFS family permease
MTEPTRRKRRPATPPAPEESALAVLGNKRFSALWLAQVATQVGGNMVLYGLTILVYGLTRSNSAVSLLILTFLVPAVIFSAVAGVYVDNLDRRLILIVTNVLRAVAFVGMFLAGSSVLGPLPAVTLLLVIYLLNVFVSTATTFFAPAEASMIPVVVERRHLIQANGLFTFTLQASFALGFAVLGPLMVNLASTEALLLFVAVLYLAAAGLCATLPPQPPATGLSPVVAIGEAEQAVASTVGQLREGLDYIRGHHSIFWSLSYLGITASLIGVLGVLGPDFAFEALGLREQDFVVVVLPLGFGLVIGVLTLNVYGRFLPRRRVIEGGLVGLACGLAILSVAGPISRFLQAGAQGPLADLGPVVSLLAIVVLLALLSGIFYAFVAVPAQTQLQEELPGDVRGRVFGVLNMLVSIASFLPIIMVGPIADFIGTPAVILLCSILVGAFGVASIFFAHPARVGYAVPGGAHVPVDPVAVTTVPLPRADGALGEPSSGAGSGGGQPESRSSDARRRAARG